MRARRKVRAKLLSIEEAVQAGIARVRDPQWANPEAYMLLHLVDGKMGPWILAFDRTTQEAIGQPTPQRIGVWHPWLHTNVKGVVAYTGPRDREDREP